MVFVFTGLGPGLPVTEIDDEYFVSRSCPIGYDPRDSINYTIAVQFSIDDEEVFLNFGIGYDAGRYDQDFIVNSHDANAIIPKQHRQDIQTLLGYLTRELLASHQPQCFIMDTVVPQTAAKSLVKYERLCEIFRSYGYHVLHEELPSYHHRWTMTQAT